MDVSTTVLPVYNKVESSPVTSYTTISTTFESITLLTVSITTTGGNVVVGVVGANNGIASFNGSTSVAAGTTDYIGAEFQVNRGVTFVGGANFKSFFSNTTAGGISAGASTTLPGMFFDSPSAGTHTYTVQIRKTNSTSGTAGLSNVKLVAYETY